MRVVKRFCILVFVVGACQSREKSAPEPAPTPTVAAPAPATELTNDYAGDIARLCDAVKLSGADGVPAGERALPIANWLAASLKTQDSRKFLVHIQPLVGNDKAKALDDEAKRVGLGGCALADEWRTPTTM